MQAKLPPGANRILFVKNLNYQITGEDLYDLFGRYGSIRQIRIGNEPKTKGTAFVVFDDVMDVRLVLSFLPPQSPPNVTIGYEPGQERAGTFKWVSFARAVYRGAVPYACETGCGGSQGRAGTERGGAGTAEEEAQREGRGLMLARCIFILCVCFFVDAQWSTASVHYYFIIIATASRLDSTRVTARRAPPSLSSSPLPIRLLTRQPHFSSALPTILRAAPPTLWGWQE